MLLSWLTVFLFFLQVTRWLEPCIDYGPGRTHAAPLQDAAIDLKRRACELLSRKGAHELEASQRVDCVSRVLSHFASHAVVSYHTNELPHSAFTARARAPV